MSFAKPFRRNFRKMTPGPNAAYSSWLYINDPDYAADAEHYVRAYMLIQDELKSIFEYAEPSNICRNTYSFQIHALFMRTCIEIEANFKAILSENKFTPPANGFLNINHYRRIDVTHHLSSYEVKLPTWDGNLKIFKPFEAWRSKRGSADSAGTSLTWYQAYNASKHDRHQEFKKANLLNLTTAVAGLLAVITSQFRDRDFTAGHDFITIEDGDFEYQPAIGSFFRVKYPEDWIAEEMYEFDWNAVRNQRVRFAKIDFDAIPS